MDSRTRDGDLEAERDNGIGRSERHRCDTTEIQRHLSANHIHRIVRSTVYCSVRQQQSATTGDAFCGREAIEV